jgi:hypothetical protein
VSFWVLIVVYHFGGVVEADLFYTKAKCEAVAAIVARLGKTSCELVSVKGESPK